MNQLLESQLQDLGCKKQLQSLYVVQQYRFSFKLPAFFGAFAKLRKAAVSFAMSVHLSVRPNGTTRLPLDGF
jgi:hypothetical protein